MFLDVFDNVDFTSLLGLVDWLKSIFSNLVEFIKIIILLPVMVGDFFPEPFSEIITIFFYISIIILLYKFFINKD